ncbi:MULTISPECIES: thiamine pyrophosphate-binding protein [unclassified Rhizobium]|uniref:thiamine pyrophosphate-binding protein n=1 Tax=unclassified Rhizobium TaxID=2613769 RepID=UPI001ADCE27A|nr:MULTISPECIES: thiamine pyrophosphate-binding protein [unclassified Rhizobium]MBO9102015.1 thiamine pyrophosphate-binding protein [Rhizobium sp. L58/93]MBO9136183.1 thiamine pyrophosphate-binding protein [Rhizobium sp. B209b/85]MBO9171863.1 thiamine pyrophosphate-binding protein [Rhizobium sp. L245/93]MBO9187965.1 thiamine pyrophosphate-binding protein [Rhizobium sp. E27B/91]QXZ86052.1 thiamine pyrophosphate-binding protein [Rhizobium sp. K1/93]
MELRQNTMTGARLLVNALVTQGVDRVFCVPGESYLGVLDGLADVQDVIQTITCRHEGGAAMMAEADGKLTGRPGICMVTRGPGATNASAGVHVAFQDSTPLILFIGQVGNDVMEREGFQEIDYRRMFGQMAKWVAQIDHADRVHEFVGRAFAVATSGRPGPVVLALPEDMLVAEAPQPATKRVRPFEISPSVAQMQDFSGMISAAEKPVIVIGGSRWSEPAKRAVEEFAERNALPVIAAFRRQDKFDNDHPCYIGEIGLGVNPALRKTIDDADLVILLGTRMGEVASSGYAMLDVPSPRQKLIHIHASADELGRVYAPDLSINATPQGFSSMLSALPLLKHNTWPERTAAARSQYEAWQLPKPVPGAFNLGEAILWLRDYLGEDAILTNGAGNFSAWLHRFHRHRRIGTQLAPTSGSMGYGVPAAVAAKLRFADRQVVCIAGDGDFMMTGQELATAIQYKIAPIFVVVDNGMLGTIRMHQESRFPSRPMATDLVNPDFVLLARAYGAHAEYVERTEDFTAAFQRAEAAGRVALIHVKVDPDALTANRSLTQIRNAALGT